jgi:hypothetical protein
MFNKPKNQLMEGFVYASVGLAGFGNEKTTLSEQ